MNPYDELYDSEMTDRRFQKLKELARPKPYSTRAKPYFILAIIGGIFCSLYSISSAFSFLYFKGSEFMGWILAALFTVALLVLWELTKRKIIFDFMEQWKFHDTVKHDLLAGMIFFLIGSCALSFFGIRLAIEHFTPAYEEQKVADNSEAVELEAEISALNSQIEEARNTKWKGTTTNDAQRQITALTPSLTAKMDRLGILRERIDGNNLKGEIFHSENVNRNAATFSGITLIIELGLIAQCLFIVHYNRRTYIEEVKIREQKRKVPPKTSGSGNEVPETSGKKNPSGNIPSGTPSGAVDDIQLEIYSDDFQGGN